MYNKKNNDPLLTQKNNFVTKRHKLLAAEMSSLATDVSFRLIKRDSDTATLKWNEISHFCSLLLIICHLGESTSCLIARPPPPPPPPHDQYFIFCQ